MFGSARPIALARGDDLFPSGPVRDSYGPGRGRGEGLVRPEGDEHVLQPGCESLRRHHGIEVAGLERGLSGVGRPRDSDPGHGLDDAWPREAHGRLTDADAQIGG